MIEIRVCMQYPKLKQIVRPNTRQKCMKMITPCTHAPLGFHPLLAFKMAMVCMLSILAKKNKTKDHKSLDDAFKKVT